MSFLLKKQKSRDHVSNINGPPDFCAVLCPETDMHQILSPPFAVHLQFLS